MESESDRSEVWLSASQGSGERTICLGKFPQTGLAPHEFRLSQAKTRIMQMSEAFDFLGFRLLWKRRRAPTSGVSTLSGATNRPFRWIKGHDLCFTSRTSSKTYGQC